MYSFPFLGPCLLLQLNLTTLSHGDLVGFLDISCLVVGPLVHGVLFKLPHFTLTWQFCCGGVQKGILPGWWVALLTHSVLFLLSLTSFLLTLWAPRTGFFILFLLSWPRIGSTPRPHVLVNICINLICLQMPRKTHLSFHLHVCYKTPANLDIYKQWVASINLTHLRFW